MPETKNNLHKDLLPQDEGEERHDWVWDRRSYRARRDWLTHPSNENWSIETLTQVARVINGDHQVIMGVGTQPLVLYAETAVPNDERKIVSLDFLPVVVMQLLIARYLQFCQETNTNHCLNKERGATLKEVEAEARRFEADARQFLMQVLSDDSLRESFMDQYVDLEGLLQRILQSYSFQRVCPPYLFNMKKRQAILDATYEDRIVFKPTDFSDTQAVLSQLEGYSKKNGDVCMILSNVVQATENYNLLRELFLSKKVESLVLSVTTSGGKPQSRDTGYYFVNVQPPNYEASTIAPGIPFLIQAIRLN